MRAAVRAIYREGGGFAFWRGNGANILKVVPETGVKFATFDALKHLIAVDPGNATTSERFVAGGIAGATAQLVIYPLEIVKTRMALSGGGGSVTVGSSHSSFTAGNSGTGGSGGGAFKPPPRVTIAGTLRAVLHESGPKGLFRGLTPSLVGIVPYAGIDLMANRYVPCVSQIQAPTFTDPL
jgi:solute carrier family 25 phosphate transporter 23/24/25/41